MSEEIELEPSVQRVHQPSPAPTTATESQESWLESVSPVVVMTKQVKSSFRGDLDIAGMETEIDRNTDYLVVQIAYLAAMMKPEAREALAGKIKLSLEVEAEQAYGLRKQKAPKRRFHELWCGNCKMSNHNTEDCFRKKYRPDRSFVETLVDRSS